MIEPADDFERFLNLLEDEGCLKDVMVIGSWAEYLYGEAGVIEGSVPSLKTMDIDFLVRNLRRPNPPVNVPSAARAIGYVPEADRLDGVTKIYSDSGLEIEFLICKRGAGRESALKTNIGVTAQALWHLDVLLSNPVVAPWRGMDVPVPSPEAYVAHKMVINGERGTKAEKDAAAILDLFPFINNADFEAVLESLTRKERTRVARYMDSHGFSPR